MCPLNVDFWPGLPTTRDRLNLYVPRTIWRWWKYGPTDNRRCHGKVTEVKENLNLHIVYDDKGSEEVDEKTYLNIVSIMKKDISKGKKKRKR